MKSHALLYPLLAFLCFADFSEHGIRNPYEFIYAGLKKSGKTIIHYVNQPLGPGAMKSFRIVDRGEDGYVVPAEGFPRDKDGFDEIVVRLYQGEFQEYCPPSKEEIAEVTRAFKENSDISMAASSLQAEALSEIGDYYVGLD